MHFPASCPTLPFLCLPIRWYPRSLVLTEPQVHPSSRAQAEGPFRASSSSPFGVFVHPTRNNGTTTFSVLWGRDGCSKWDMSVHAVRTSWEPVVPQIPARSAQLAPPASFQLPLLKT